MTESSEKLKTSKIGKLEDKVISLLSLDFDSGSPIYIGESNIEHMKNTHPDDYNKYGNKISEIISAPDYLRQNPKDGSIEYVKEYRVNNEFVKVAVRVSGSGVLFARSVYVLNANRINNFIKKGTLKKLDK